MVHYILLPMEMEAYSSSTGKEGITHNRKHAIQDDGTGLANLSAQPPSLNYYMLNKLHILVRRWPAFLAGVLSLWAGAFSSIALAGSALLAWDASPAGNLGGYRVHYGTESGVYTTTTDVGNHTEATIPNLSVHTTYFFAVTAYDTAALESEPSNEVALTIEPLPITFGGTYSGASVDTGGMSAFVELNVTKSRQFTGRAIIGNFSTAVKGTFSEDGTGTVDLSVPQPTPWQFTFQLNPGSRSMDVRLLQGAVDLSLTLAATPYSSVNPAPQAGNYTIQIGALAPTAESTFETPGEGGFAVTKITPVGRVRNTGRLADGSAFTSSAYLGSDGQFLVHSPLYGKSGGILAGGLSIRETADISDGDGGLSWKKPALPTARFYKQGFIGTVPILISRFQRIPSLQSLNLDQTVPARVVLTGGGLQAPAAIERNLAFLNGNSVTIINSASENLRIQIRTTSGVIAGTFIHPSDGRLRAIAGVLFQKQGSGAGFFSGIHTTGLLKLTGIWPSAPE